MKLNVENTKLQYRNYKTNYFCGVIQSKVTKEQVSETGKKRIRRKTTG